MATNRKFFVYILASSRRGTLYVGVTSDLPGRVWQHKNKAVEGFTEKYGVTKLVFSEACESAEGAIAREKQIKKWRREWKLELVEQTNPDWCDLYKEIL